jgi:integrase
MASKLPAQITKGTDSKGQYWQLRMSFGPRDNRQQINRKYRTETEAIDVFTELSGQKAKGITAVVSKITVEKACADWLASKRGRNTSKSPRFYSLQPLRKRHGSDLLTELSNTDLDKLINDLMAGGIVPAKNRRRRAWQLSSVQLMLRHITAMLDFYERQGKLVRNVAKLVDLPDGRARRYNTFNEDEVRKFLDWAAEDRREHIWHLALSGLRRGEICGLRWDDVDLKAGTLTVDDDHNRVTVMGGVEDGDTKTETAQRTLPLTPTLKAVLRAAKVRQAEEKLKAGQLYKSLDYVAASEFGEPYFPNSLSKGWTRVCKRAGVKVIRLHDARHTCGTLMALQNVPPVVIAAWLGHSNPAFTMRVYAHPPKDGLEAGRDVLQALALPKSEAAKFQDPTALMDAVNEVLRRAGHPGMDSADAEFVREQLARMAEVVEIKEAQ